jgi:hypothetical protein
VIDHLVYAASDLQAAVADVEERFGVRARTGGRHVGRGTRNAAPSGLILEAFHIEHPDPPSLVPALTALGADAEIRQVAAAALVARLSGPNGSMVLR